MSKWEKVKLGDVATYINGHAFRPSQWKEIGLPIIRIQNLNDEGASFNYCDEAIDAKYIVNDGDVLISWSASLGVFKWNRGKALLNQHIFKVVFDKLQVDKNYFVYTVNRLLNDMVRQTHGSTMKHITKGKFDNMLFPLPPLEEQRQIAETLDTVSEMLAMRKQQLAELDNLINSIFYDMFGDPVTNEKGWKTLSLNDTCRKITDGTHHSPPSFPEGNYMYITAKNIRKDGLDLDNITYVSEEDHKRIISRCAPEFGDILYIKDGVTTGIAQVNYLNEEFSLLSSVALLKPDNSLINSYFLREVLNNDNMYNSIRSNMGGAAITRLTLRKIGAIIIPIPPISLQNEFSKVLFSIEKQKRNIKSAIRETQYLFDSLMSRYFD